MDNDLLDITKLRRWRIWKLKLIDARLYFVSIFVGLLTGLVAVPYHYLLQQLFNSRKLFFDGHYPWYFHVLFFFTLWGILLCVNWMVKKMPLITGGGIPQTRAVINGRITYKNPLTQLIAKFTGGILAISAGLSLGVVRGRAYRSDLTWGISFPNGDTYWLESASNFWPPAQVPDWPPLSPLPSLPHFW